MTDAESTDDVQTLIHKQDPHVMLYTSGTTGSSKGTLLSQRSYYLQATTSQAGPPGQLQEGAARLFPASIAASLRRFGLALDCDSYTVRSWIK